MCGHLRMGAGSLPPPLRIGRYAEVLPDEKATTAIAFLRRAVAFYERHGITVERLLTDNGSAYRSMLHAFACRAHD
jgi:hypothetical protein